MSFYIVPQVNQGTSQSSRQEKATFRLATRLIQTANNSRLDDEALRLYLKGLKRQYEADIFGNNE